MILAMAAQQLNMPIPVGGARAAWPRRWRRS